MSLENAIETLAGAVKQLAEAVAVHQAATATATESPPPSGKPGRGRKAKEAEPAAKEEPAEAKSAAKQPDPEPDASAGASTHTKEYFDTHVGKPFVELIRTKGTEAGRAIIDHFDKSKSRLSEALKPEQYEVAATLIAEALEAEAPGEDDVSV